MSENRISWLRTGGKWVGWHNGVEARLIPWQDEIGSAVSVEVAGGDLGTVAAAFPDHALADAKAWAEDEMRKLVCA